MIDLKLKFDRFDKANLGDQQLQIANEAVNYFRSEINEYYRLSNDEVQMNLFFEEISRNLLSNSPWNLCPYIISVNENTMREEEFYIFKQRTFSIKEISSVKEVYNFNFNLAVMLNALRIKKLFEKMASETEALSLRFKLIDNYHHG